MQNIPPFTGGHDSVRDKLNAMRDEINALSKLIGDGQFICVQKGPAGVVIGPGPALLNRPMPVAQLPMQLFIVSVQADYLTCNTKSDGSGTTFYVAKPPRLRSTDTAARAVAGQTYTVTKSAFTTGIASGDAQTCTATRSSDSGTDTLEVVEPYLAGDEITAIPYATGIVDGSSNPINLLDANVDARHWAVKSTA